MIVPLGRRADLSSARITHELKHRNAVIFDELRTKRPSNRSFKFLLAERKHILDLAKSEPIIRCLHFNWQDVMGTAPINPDVQLVDLNLPDFIQGVRRCDWIEKQLRRVKMSIRRLYRMIANSACSSDCLYKLTRAGVESGMSTSASARFGVNMLCDTSANSYSPLPTERMTHSEFSGAVKVISSGNVRLERNV